MLKNNKNKFNSVFVYFNVTPQPEYRLHEGLDCVLFTTSKELAVERVAVMHCFNLGGLKEQEFLLSQFRRPDIRHQGVGRTKLPRETLGQNPSFLLPAPDNSAHSLASLACGHRTPIWLCLHVAFSSLLWFSSSVSYKIIRVI